MNSANKPLNRDKIRSAEIDDELATVSLMIDIYCRSKHRTRQELCGQCRELKDYAERRLMRCPYYDQKMPCNDCQTHCYREPYVRQIREVMRFSGPRIIIHHPTLAVRHFAKRINIHRKK